MKADKINQIPRDPEALKDRLNQPRTTLAEALKQFQATTKSSPTEQPASPPNKPG